LAGRWRIISHPQREWIIQAGRARCAVGPDLGRALLPLDGQAPDQEAVRRCLAKAGRDHGPTGETVAELSVRLVRILAGPPSGRSFAGRRAIWLRVPLVPAWLVQRLAGFFGPLAGSRSLPLAAGAGLLGYLAGASAGTLTGPRSWHESAGGLLLFLATGIFHELGHAAALKRQGYPPGGIGLGVLFVLPVLFADVSAVAVLPRGGRIRVDLAGVCFQILAGGLLFGTGTFLPGQPFGRLLQLGGVLALPAVAWSLLPFIRADGYWFLADLLRLTDLEQPVPPGRTARLRVFLVLHRLANAGFLLLVGVAFPLRYLGFLARPGILTGASLFLVRVLAVVAVLWLWFGLGRRLFLLLRSCLADLADLLRPGHLSKD